MSFVFFLQLSQSLAAENETLVSFGYSSVTTDYGWTMAHDNGRKYVEKNVAGVKTVYVEKLPFSDETSRTLEQFIANGSKMIIAASEYGEFIYKVAKRHPEITFLECNGARQFDNVSSYWIAHEMADYLLGVAAGLLTKTNKLGFVTSFPIPLNFSYANAFVMGAQSVNPNATVRVIMINSWFDPPAHSQATATLIQGGADFIFSNLDDPSGIQTANKHNTWVASAFTNRGHFGPEKYVNSCVFNWGPHYAKEVESFKTGTWKGNRSVILKLGEGVDLGEWGKNVPQQVRVQVEEVRRKMLEENFYPFTGPLYDNKGKLRVENNSILDPEFIRHKWDWALKGVTGLK